MSSIIYVYGFIPQGVLPREVEIQGLEPGQPVIQEEFSDISAVMSYVPLSDFVGEDAELRLQDIEWVGPRAVNHQRAIEKILDYSPILPAQFGALFSCLENLEQYVSGNHPEIKEFLELVLDKREWGVKLYWEDSQKRQRLMDTEYSQKLEQLENLSDGVRYFKEKQFRAEIEKRATEWLRSILVESSSLLSALSHTARKRRILADDSEGEGRQMVANWAFLVENAKTAEFMSIVNDLNKRESENGILALVSGPWPPYSFVPSLTLEYT